MNDPQLVRVVGPVIAQMDQVTAAVSEMTRTLSAAIADLAVQVDRMSAPVVQVPAPPPPVVPEMRFPEDLAARLVEAVRPPKELVDLLRDRDTPNPRMPQVVAGGGRRDIRDFYAAGTQLDTVTGNDAATTVNLVQWHESVWLIADGDGATVDPFGGVADADSLPLFADQWHPFDLRVQSVSVFAPTGTSVRGYALRYV